MPTTLQSGEGSKAVRELVEYTDFSRNEPLEKLGEPDTQRVSLSFMMLS